MDLSKLGGGLGIGIPSEEELAVKSLFPAKNKAQNLQMITDIQPKAIVPLSALGLIRRRFDSSIIKMWEEEYYSILLSKDRKGRLELSEIFVARRAGKEEED